MAVRSILALLLAAGLGCGSSSAPNPEELLFSDQFLNIAHRGGRAIRPEHTMVAYEHALSVGADVLELDVHATSDGILVVMHDSTIDRTTNGIGAIQELTFEEIRTFDAAFRFTEDGGETFPFRGQGLLVPTLAEVFEAFPDVPYVIEVKQESPSIIDAFVVLCREHGAIDQMIGAAFSDQVLVELREAAPEMATSMALVEVAAFWGLPPEDEATYEPPGEFLQVPTTFQGIDVLIPSFLERAERFGLKIQVWTINDADQMGDLVQLGVDGIITDYPDRLSEVIGR